MEVSRTDSLNGSASSEQVTSAQVVKEEVISFSFKLNNPLANITDSPLTFGSAFEHRSFVKCFSIRKAMGMRLSRYELHFCTVDKLKEMKTSDLMSFLKRAEKTMQSSSLPAKSVHIMKLLHEFENGKPNILNNLQNDESIEFKVRFDKLINKIEKKENDVKERFEEKKGKHNELNDTLNTVCFEDTIFTRFEKHFASTLISSRELEELSIKTLLKQSPSDLLRFLERAETTIINTKRSNKSLQLISLLIQVYKKLDDYILAEIAGNTQAKKVNRSLERILDLFAVNVFPAEGSQESFMLTSSSNA